MDETNLRDGVLEVDLEKGERIYNSGIKKQGLVVVAKVEINRKLEGERSHDELVEKERCKKSSNKKPPRPPKGPSLDAADQKLIKEIAELAMIKRARHERIKALKKMKTAKASSSSYGNIVATLFTLLFCLVILIQGISSRRTPGSFQGSPMASSTVDNDFISVQYIHNANEPTVAYSGSSNLVERVSSMDPEEKLKRVSE